MTAENDFAAITQAVMKAYNDELAKYLAKPLTEADVILMIMNLTMSVSTNIYYSLKKYLPQTEMDFDFMRAKICNSIVDSLDGIKSYNPSQETMQLTPEQLKEINSLGFINLKMPDGSMKKVTEKDILIHKDDLEKLMAETKNKVIQENARPKIITRSH